MSSTTTSNENTKSTLYNQIHTRALNFIQSFATARTQGSSALNAHLAPHCKRFYSPLSLASMLPQSFTTDGESNTAYATRMQVELDATTQPRAPEIRSVVVDETEGKAVVHCVLWNRSVKTGREYAFEFAFFLDFDVEKGEAKVIERIQVFADPGMARRFFEENEEVAETVAN